MIAGLVWSWRIEKSGAVDLDRYAFIISPTVLINILKKKTSVLPGSQTNY